MISIARESPYQKGVPALIRLSDEGSAALYPPESRHALDLDALVAQDVRLFVARLDGRAVGCCGFALDEDGTGELKRLFVDPAARGQGIARRLIETVEAAARDERIRIMRLETGIHSPEAIALYHSFGYRERGPFGRYHPDPNCVYMERALA